MAEDVGSPNQLIDIIAPVIPMPAGQSISWAAVIAVLSLVLAVSMWVYRRWNGSVKKLTLRRLKHLHTAFRNHLVSAREVSYWLADLFKRRLHINHLIPGLELPVSLTLEQRRWDSFVQRLNETRYAPGNISEQDVIGLLAEAEYWLKRWP